MLNPRTTQDPCVRSRLPASVWRATRMLAAAAAAGCLFACSPALDWRQAGPKEVDILLDFPCNLKGRVVLLCWKQGETAIEHWHTTQEGFANRKPLDPSMYSQDPPHRVH